MTDAPYTGDLDLTAVTTKGELAALLRTVHLRADRPSLRTLEARTRHDLTPLSKTAVSEMLKGTHLPRKAVMVAFLKACGEHDDRIEAWRRAWDRSAEVEHRSAGSGAATPVPRQPAQGAAAGSGGAPGSGTAEAEKLRAEIRKLDEDNKRLRLQIRSASHSGATPQTRSSERASVRQARGPELPRRELSAELRVLRAARAMTVEQVADHLLCSLAKVRRMENGFRSGTARDIRDLCDLYGVSDADQRDHLMELARQSKQHGWWQGYDLPYETYIGLEADASSIKACELTVVPGLLQTADYSRTVTDAASAGGLDPDAIERRVQARLIRQRLLTRDDPPLFSAVLDEAALHRLVGSTAVMAAQLGQLIDFSILENVTIKIVPYESGAHPGFNAFNILEFGTSSPSVVYVEGVFGEIYIERPREVNWFQKVFAALHAKALDKDGSRALIKRIQKDL